MSKKCLFVFLFFLAIFIIAGVWLSVKKLETQPPIIRPTEEIKFLRKAKNLEYEFEDTGSGLRSVEIFLSQNDTQKDIHSEKINKSLMWKINEISKSRVMVTIDPAKMKLKEGDATFHVIAYDFSWRNGFRGNQAILQQSFILDRTPPSLSTISRQHYLNQGGTGFIVYETSQDSSRSGVYINDKFFPGFSAGSEKNPLVHVAFFAIPFDQGPDPQLELFAQDEAGNETRTGFHYMILKKKFKKDSLPISEGFLKKKIPQFYKIDEDLREMPMDAAFLKINNEMRKADHARIFEICQKTDTKKLWDGVFVRLPNAKPCALFADHRSYIYGDKKIDEQIHLGIDLASLANSSVPAANSGIVIYAGEIGIYGKTVIIDHGQNLFSMYGHLNSFACSENSVVKKGDIIGKTGETGWAGGDHLHFSMIVGGEFVNPIEWFDSHWIKDNIYLKLEDL
ncbi:M23 family metallopeptidase [bacterium]|nr:M23 family metallopeptidase [bacterium]